MELDPSKLRLQIRQGTAAQAVLESDGWKMGVLQVQDDIVVEWRGLIDAKEVRERERLHAELSALDRVEHRLRTLVTEGEGAAELLRKQAEKEAKAESKT